MTTTNVHANQHSKTQPSTDIVPDTTIVRRVHAVPDALFTAWSRVNVCEEGGNWNAYGYYYPDALGISRAAWVFFGGLITKTYRPSIRDQIIIGDKVIHYYHIPIPDKEGCHAW